MERGLAWICHHVDLATNRCWRICQFLVVDVVARSLSSHPTQRLCVFHARICALLWHVVAGRGDYLAFGRCADGRRAGHCLGQPPPKRLSALRFFRQSQTLHRGAFRLKRAHGVLGVVFAAHIKRRLVILIQRGNDLGVL